jgi:hypothetical protein
MMEYQITSVQPIRFKRECSLNDSKRTAYSDKLFQQETTEKDTTRIARKMVALVLLDINV